MNRIHLLIVMLVAFVIRALMIASNTISFHSDEAVVALMARHINAGEYPIFFYGQAYMGSLDAWLVSFAFRIFGEQVLSIRIVQAVLYLAIVATTYLLAWRLTRRPIIAAAAGLSLAIPTVLFATYTSATLGGYGETLLLGNITLILGYAVTHDRARSVWRWFALGVVVGVGWWTNALIAVYAAPVVVMILYVAVRQRRPLISQVGLIGLGLAGFVIGAAPWLIYALQTDFAPLRFLVGGTSGDFAGTDVFTMPLDQRLIGFFFLGLPTLWGLRFPWFSDYFMPALGMVVTLIYIFAVMQFLRKNRFEKDGRLLMISYSVIFCVVFLGSRFSFDPTGRYLLPLVLPLAVTFGALIDQLWGQRRGLAVLVGVVVLGYSALGLVATATSYPGFTTQFNLDTHIPNDDDAALIAWLDEHNITRGYTNYWLTFRLAFLSEERHQFSAAMPYLPIMNYSPFDERYPPYREAADNADEIAYIFPYSNENVLPIQARLEAIFAEHGVTYQREMVGVYSIYYDFEPSAPRPPLNFRD